MPMDDEMNERPSRRRGTGRSQTVVHRSYRSAHDDETRAASLVVVPRSLVQNWIEEATRFTPDLAVLDYTGLDRKPRFDELSKHVGATVTVRGWVTHLRSSGKIAFIVLRDGTGLLQAVLVKNQ